MPRLQSQFEVQPAGPADLDVLGPLFDDYRQFYGQPHDLTVAREFLSQRLEAGDSVIFLARSAIGVGLGFVQLYPVFSSTATRPGRLWLVNDLYVSLRARARGVGRALMERARQLALETDATGLFLQTAKSNTDAQHLYESLGYRRDDLFLVYELPLR